MRRRSAVALGLFSLVAGLCAAAPPAAETRAPADLRRWVAPRVDVAALLRQDEASRSRSDLPRRVAHAMKVGLSPADSGVWQELPDGDRVWRLAVSSPGALWLALGFAEIDLPAGARVTVSDAERRVTRGPYGDGDGRKGPLWTPPLPGDAAIVELHWPAAFRSTAPALYLGHVSHGYRSEIEPVGDSSPLAPAGSGFCNIDINCPLGAAWQQQKLGVVRLFIGGQVVCTGSLINNTAQDCTPYVLTAYHCYHPPGLPAMDPATTVVRFNYERQGCEFGTAPVDQEVSGAELVAENFASDFLLLRMTQSPPSNYATFFNGWSRSSVPADATWSIHYPSADPRKITHDDDPPLPGPAGTLYWRIEDWEVGTTEAGSSGAPLFDPDKRIVGQLRGGQSGCELFLFDEFGKLSGSWDRTFPFDIPAVRLREWLDPLATGLATLDGLEPSYCELPRPRLVRRESLVLDASGNRNGVLDPGDRLTIAIDVQNHGTQTATAVTGTLISPLPAVTVLNPTVSWPDLDPLETAGGAEPFNVVVSPDLPCGQNVTLTFGVETAQGNFVLPLPLENGVIAIAPLVTDDFEAGVGSWTQQTVTTAGFVANTWSLSTALATSPSHSWFIPDIGGKSDTRLVMAPTVVLPAETQLRFSHYMNSEPSFDGGRLEYTINAGATWLPVASNLFRAGGYNSTLAAGSALAGQAAWSGDLGSFQDVEVDLSSLVGRTIQLRWRFATDLSNADVGWYVDDVRLEDVNHTCAPQPPARRSPGERCVDDPARCSGTRRPPVHPGSKRR